jgi:hypothetical protein
LTWPFSNAGTWTDGVSELTPDQANLLSIQLGRAASGEMYSDRVLARSFKALTWPGNASNTSYASTWDASARRWYVFGVASGAPEGASFRSGSESPTLNLTIPADDGLVARSAASSGAGIIVLAGLPGASSALKYRRTSGSGSTFTSGTSAQASTASADCVVWHVDKFIGGLSTGEIETSADGTTWVDQTVPNADARSSAAGNGTTVLVASSGVARAVSSTNGTTWTERTLPGAVNDAQVAWVGGRLQKWLIVGSNAAYSSTDLVTWTAVATASGKAVVTYNRMAVTANSGIIVASIDAAATWVASFEAPATIHHINAGAAQFIAIDDNENLLMGFGSGAI